MSYKPQQCFTVSDVSRELERIAVHLDEMDVESIRLMTHHSEPSKPREGNIYRADGTDWDPGSGEGVYEYTNAGAWSKL